MWTICVFENGKISFNECKGWTLSKMSLYCEEYIPYYGIVKLQSTP